jgi:hypothetical protein
MLERHPLSTKIWSVIKAPLIALVLAAGATQSPPAWAQSAELIGAFKQYQTLNKRCTRAGSSPPAAAKL